uniref:Peptidase C1A papain C-terminal domain-containing protein n=1 Tax=Romanomermis culicivorax TaxID=13658 RepID=A0A915HQG6_ROMCU
MPTALEKQIIDVHWATLINASGPHEKDTIASLLHWGPIVAIVDANQAWQFYSGSGVLSAHQCSKNQNHAVLIVGYDFTGPVPFYVIKNSWGTKWGDRGFLRLEAGRNTCGVAKNLAICCTHGCENLDKGIGGRLNTFGCNSSSSHYKKKFS